MARSAQKMFAQTILSLEIVVVFFAGMTAWSLKLAEPGTVWALTGGLIGVAVLAMAFPGRVGYSLGSVLQLAVLASGFLIPTMWVLGGIFALLWITALVLGRRIDTERVQRSALGP